MNIQKPIKLGDLNNLSLTQKMGLNQKKTQTQKPSGLGFLKNSSSFNPGSEKPRSNLKKQPITPKTRKPKKP